MKSFAPLALALLAFAAPAVAQDAARAPAAEPVWHTGVSMMGEPKYADGFTQFDYVDPNAPKGGVVRLSAQGSFDTFNPILPKGEVVDGTGHIYESLLAPPMDEVNTGYGLLAEALSYPDDFSSVTFRLDPAARWNDGQPVTPDDVVWSFLRAIELNPFIREYYENVTAIEATGEREVTFRFDQTGNRELPQIIGQMPVLPMHWWEGKDAAGKQRDIGASSLEPPLGSGPYEIASFNAGTSVVFKRVPGYWAANKNINVGQNNFDEMHYEYFRDTDVAFEAFKGDEFDWWDENRARRWATAYDFPAVTAGRVVREEFEEPHRSSGNMVGFIFNTRLPKFKDVRVREALNYAFDFEELSRTMFYNLYARVDSYFFGTELASSGLPEGKELEILETVRDQVPPSVFTEPYINPVSGDAARLRDNLRTALALLTEAGYTLQGNTLVDAAGQPFTIEILLGGPTIEPVAANLQTNLRKIGIEVTIRSVELAQFGDRLRNRDFEMAYNGWAQSLSPGNEQRSYWGSPAADEVNSRNFAGIKDPAVDALIDKIIFAADRETLVAATKALDRVLLAGHYVIPSYASDRSRIARWDRFSRPATLPTYAHGFPTTWWYDPAKAAKTDAQ